MKSRSLSLCLLATLCACDEPKTAEEVVEPPSGAVELALDLYARVATRNEGNLFFSPYSISSALAMTYAGAAGPTKEEMARALRFDKDEEAVHAGFGKLTAALNKLGKSGQVKLSVANALWAQKGYPIREEFSALNAKHYGAGVTELAGC